MRGLVLFNGKYGATDQYASWIGNRLHVPTVEAGPLSSILLQDYEYLVIGSSVYMGKLVLADWLKKYASLLKNHKLFIFIVCATPSTDKTGQDQIIRENIPESLLNKSSIFFLPGRLDLKALNWSDKFAIKVVRWFEKDPEKRKVLINGIDAVKEENISGFIGEIEKFSFSDKLR